MKKKRKKSRRTTNNEFLEFFKGLLDWSELLLQVLLQNEL